MAANRDMNKCPSYIQTGGKKHRGCPNHGLGHLCNNDPGHYGRHMCSCGMHWYRGKND